MNVIDDALFSGTMNLNRFNFPFNIYAIDDVLFQDFSGMFLFMKFQEPIFVLTWAIFSAFDWLNFTPPPPSPQNFFAYVHSQPWPWVYPGFYPWPYPCIWTFTSHFNLEPLPFPWNHIYCIYPSYPLNSGVYIIPKMFTPGRIHVGAFGMWPVREEYTSGWVLLASLAFSCLRHSAFGFMM